ncbi:MAG TPA: lysophospholipid acyltransferase family protein [Bryobacteraceae bacterium]|nr:lysophospholipid acyltransferase family protein [Bryobacteraceae bacterium]
MRTRSAFRNAVEAGLARGLIAALVYSPRPLADWLGARCARLLDLAIPRLRRIADRNLALAYPDKDTAWRRKTADGVFSSIGRLLVAFARLPHITKANVGEWIRYEGFEHYERAKERGNGVLFATAHLGNWELSAYAHALLTEPMNVVVRPLDNPVIDAIVERRRALSGNTLLSKRDFARSIFHALRRNQPVGILVDQNSAADNGAFVPFFGTLACANLTFAKLAARSGAAVIPGFAVWNRQERRYILRFYPEVEMTGEAVEDTHRIQNSIEVAIREAPDQWLWIHRRWKTRPEGEEALYR